MNPETDFKDASTLTTGIIYFLIVLIAYGNSLWGPFVYDDYWFIVSNEKIHNLWDFSAIFSFNPLRVVTFLTLALNYHWGGLNPLGYHLVNLLVHAANIYLVFQLIRLSQEKLGVNNQAKALAHLGALIFAVHPLTTQSVTYIWQRASSLLAFFYLLSCVSYFKARLAPETKHKALFLGLAWLAALLAMFTKQNAFTLPILIGLIEGFFFLDKKIDWHFFKRLLPFLLLLLVIPLLLKFFPIQELKDIQKTGSISVSPAIYLFNQFQVIRTYLRLFFFPINQALDYGYAVSLTASLEMFDSLVLLLGVLTVAFKSYATNRLLSFGILFFFITLAVESSLIPLEDIISEQRVYLPYVGLVLALSSVKILKPQDYRFWIVAFIAILTLTGLTYNRNRTWRSEARIWEDVTLKAPAKWRPKINLANVYIRTGRYDAALKLLDDGEDLTGPKAEIHFNRGLIYFKQEKFDLAVPAFEAGLKLQPKQKSALRQLAIACLQSGQYQRALKPLQQLRQLRPNDFWAYDLMGLAYKRLGNLAEAEKMLLKALQLQPGDGTIHWRLAEIYHHQNKTKKSQFHLEKARQKGITLPLKN